MTVDEEIHEASKRLSGTRTKSVEMDGRKYEITGLGIFALQTGKLKLCIIVIIQKKRIT